MRPTLDGLNATEWFTVARAGAEFWLAFVLLWFVGRCLRRGVCHLAASRREQRQREQAWRAHMELRRRRSETPLGYLRERSRGLVSYD